MAFSIYQNIASPIINKFDSESMKTMAENALHLAEMSPLTLKLLELFADKHSRFKDKRLEVAVAGIKFENPLVVAAGWDKKGRAVKALYTLGFAGVEVGTVPAYPQIGNPKPRQFLIGPGVALNRLGFNSPGMDAVAENLENYKGSRIPIGISLGKNKLIPDVAAPEMHAVVAKRLYPYASYFVINVSSPNTPGLRALQDKKPLTEIIIAVNAAMDEMGKRKPLFVKIAPDLAYSAIDDVIQVVLDQKLTGIIATNTTVNSTLKGKYGKIWENQMGGLSGDDPDYRKMATKIIAHIYKETKGKIDIMGVGGIKDAATALEKIKAGAKMVQVLTAIRGEGTAVAGKINRGLVEYMEKEGVKNISELVGVDC